MCIPSPFRSDLSAADFARGILTVAMPELHQLSKIQAALQYMTSPYLRIAVSVISEHLLWPGAHASRCGCSRSPLSGTAVQSPAGCLSSMDVVVKGSTLQNSNMTSAEHNDPMCEACSAYCAVSRNYLSLEPSATLCGSIWPVA